MVTLVSMTVYVGGLPASRVNGPADNNLGDAPCSHHGDLVQSPTIPASYMASDVDYDLGFLSDGDFGQDLRSKKRRQGSDTRFGNWSARFSSRLPSLSRWRSASTSSKAASFAYSASSDPSLASRRPSLVRAISRSSSLSGPARTASDYPAQDSDIPETPALSFYESCESVVLPSPLEVSPATVGKKLERDRTIATTPLLPPLMTEALVPASSQTRPPSLQMSPLQSPTLPSPVPDLSGTKTFPSPPLSNKPSLTSLRRGTVSSTFSDAPSPVPYLFDLQDAWSDRLGHANFTIEPKPYMPETADLATLQAFRADWNQARTNYAKHLVRISEHYGSTSNIYALTEAKWAEIDQEWQRNEDQLVERLGKNDPVALSQLRRTSEERLSPSVPRMLSDDGKFPELGDVEIVGPMQRDAVMAGNSQHERKNSVSALLKSLAGKVGLRK